MKLLLNADDLGYTPAINQAILSLHTCGQLSSTSLLVNLPYSQDAIKRLSAHPNLKIGVHLNLTKGHPVSPQMKIPSLVCTSGTFWPTKIFFLRAVAGRINRQEVEVELRAQIERALDFGIRPTHFDSHSHWHMLPYLRQLIAQLGIEYQIPGLRQSTPRRTLLPSKFWLSMICRKPQAQSETRIPFYMLSLHQWMGANGQPIDLFFNQQFCRLVAHPDMTLEMVTHPGQLEDPDFPSDTLLTHQRQWEYDFLLSPRFDEWLKRLEAKIINYAAL